MPFSEEIGRAIVIKTDRKFQRTRFFEVWDCSEVVIGWIEFANCDPPIIIAGEAPP